MSPRDSPIALLLITGGLLGLMFPFGKIAAEGGISPIVWAFVIAAGAGTILPVVIVAGRQRMGVWRPSAALLRDFGHDLLCGAEYLGVFVHSEAGCRLYEHHVHPVAGADLAVLAHLAPAACDIIGRSGDRGGICRRPDGRVDPR